MKTDNSIAIEANILAMVMSADAKARTLYPTYAVRPFPKVTFYAKGLTNGKANRNTWEVMFNTFNAEQVGDEFMNTVTHEIAHMVDYTLRGKSGHDRQWKEIHRSLGGSGTRCSTYNNVVCKPGRVTRKHLYRDAQGRELWAGGRHHASLQRGKIDGLRNRLTGAQVTRHDYTGISKAANS